ncbi:gamma-glutamyltransferase, partial [Bacillus tropicus]
QTTHFTVTDRFGNVVSYTTTIEQLFGSGIMVPGYGVVLNNELTDFDAVPGGANEVQPNKRPLSSMTPTILFKNNEPVLTVGSPGGA